MTKRAELIEEWAGGEHTFALRMRGIEELQSRVGCGIGEIFRRVYAHNWTRADLVNIVECGLIDGENMSVKDARNLVKRFYGDDPQDFRPLAEHGPAIGQPGPKSLMVLAMGILGAVMFGTDKIESEPSGEAIAATKTDT